MIGVIIAFVIAIVLSITITPLFIRFLTKNQYGQFIRQDGPTQHLTKRGTPTMGGVVFIAVSVFAWFVGNVVNQRLPDWSATLLVMLFVGLGIIGFLDDSIKIRKQRSLGLYAGMKIILQLAVGTAFALLALTGKDSHGITPGRVELSFVRPIEINIGTTSVVVTVILFVIWVNFLVAAWSNAVNLTDGLDGLATGASIFVFGAYLIISSFQFSQSCWRSTTNLAGCYETRDPLGLAIFCAAVFGALLGFLWWNASPAQIFMGDTGSLALGGAVAGMSIMTNTEFLAVIIGGLFVLVAFSDIIQIGVFKMTGKRVFRMAPLHHHFELKGWNEITIVIRFWIVAGLFAIAGVSIFYAEWVSWL